MNILFHYDILIKTFFFRGVNYIIRNPLTFDFFNVYIIRTLSLFYIPTQMFINPPLYIKKTGCN